MARSTKSPALKLPEDDPAARVAVAVIRGTEGVSGCWRVGEGWTGATVLVGRGSEVSVGRTVGLGTGVGVRVLVALGSGVTVRVGVALGAGV